MKYSLKRHLGIIFISLITGTILMCSPAQQHAVGEVLY